MVKKKKKKPCKVKISFLTREQGAQREAAAKRLEKRVLKTRKRLTYFIDPLQALQLLRSLTKLAGHFGIEGAAGFNLNNKRLATAKFFNVNDDLPVDREMEAKRRLIRDLYSRITHGEFAGVADVFQLQSSFTILEDKEQRELYTPERERPFVFTFKPREVREGLPSEDG